MELLGLLYFFIIVVANMVGAVSGMGGGVIIKPLLDLIGAHSVATISFYSSVAVFTMSLVSTYRQVRQGVVLSWMKVGFLSFGAILGGILGNHLLNWLLSNMENDEQVLVFQILLTMLSLIFAFLYSIKNLRSFNQTSKIAYLACGLVLGSLASLLGIGGGPINVSLLMLVFSLPIKEATVYSIATILFSQLSKLATILVQGQLGQFDLSLLFYIVPAAIIGGFLGAYLSKRLSVKKVERTFQAVILVVLLINLYNLIKLF
ncbi:sulfite exporter TauE/SafE family protein [Streptococcus sp. SS-4456]|uniref:sulfite exporter TauE/SafE family protein n=1 Tax=Streptococcus sp. SS-4456 TaxID=3072286 RepID=UPI002FC687F0